MVAEIPIYLSSNTVMGINILHHQVIGGQAVLKNNNGRNYVVSSKRPAREFQLF
ncbi:MAG: hypothetical protein ACLQG5_03925 [Methanobacterium sp.]|jgi:hypothetical protein